MATYAERLDAPLAEGRTLDVIDMHTAGEPVRIVVGGYPNLQGRTILDKRRDAILNHDDLRTAMMLEPRGHAGMYGVIPVDPSLPGAALAVLFCHASGYSTMCGHATIALGRWAVESGRVPHDGASARFGLELPCGLVDVEAKVERGRVSSVSFESVEAFVERRDLALDIESHGRVLCDICFGGAYYAVLPAARLGLHFEDGLPALIAAGKKVFAAARAAYSPVHPEAEDLSFLYGVILTDAAGPLATTRNLCLFGEGQIDRSPTGSGVTARMALDLLSGRIPEGASRRFTGPTGGPFEATARRIADFHGREAVRVRVSGQAYYSGRSRFVMEPADPLRDGFLLFASETA